MLAVLQQLGDAFMRMISGLFLFSIDVAIDDCISVMACL